MGNNEGLDREREEGGRHFHSGWGVVGCWFGIVDFVGVRIEDRWLVESFTGQIRFGGEVRVFGYFIYLSLTGV